MKELKHRNPVLVLVTLVIKACPLKGSLPGSASFGLHPAEWCGPRTFGAHNVMPSSSKLVEGIPIVIIVIIVY